MKIYGKRLRRGEDLLTEIENFCREKNIKAGIILSGVGCVTEGKVRNAGGKDIVEIKEGMEIVSITGTVSEIRCHLHVFYRMCRKTPCFSYGDIRHFH